MKAVDRFFNNLLCVNSGQTLKRIGSEYDGGYIVPYELYKSTPILVSIGIGDNMDFEIQSARDGKLVYCYDNSIDSLPLQEKNVYFEKKEYEDAINCRRDNRLEMLKVDVEGAEFEYIHAFHYFTIIIMEFHVLTFDYSGGHSPYFTGLYNKLYEDRNEKQFKYYNDLLEYILKTHNIIHIHGNNSLSKVKCLGYEFPPLMELTFMNKQYFWTSPYNTPNIIPEDRPNKTDRPDFTSLYPFKI